MGVAPNTTRLAAAVCDCWLLLYVTAAAAHNYFSQDEAFVLSSVEYSHVERLAVLRRWAGGGDLCRLSAAARASSPVVVVVLCFVFLKPRGGTLSPQRPTLVYWLSAAARACCLLTCFSEANSSARVLMCADPKLRNPRAWWLHAPECLCLVTWSPDDTGRNTRALFFDAHA